MSCHVHLLPLLCMYVCNVHLLLLLLLYITFYFFYFFLNSIGVEVLKVTPALSSSNLHASV